jgi:hypothetical protein
MLAMLMLPPVFFYHHMRKRRNSCPFSEENFKNGKEKRKIEKAD